MEGLGPYIVEDRHMLSRVAADRSKSRMISEKKITFRYKDLVPN